MRFNSSISKRSMISGNVMESNRTINDANGYYLPFFDEKN
jgi:hypothetical protein